MTCLIYIVGRTDGKQDFHTLSFIRETSDLQLERFVTTSVIAGAKKFRNEVTAMKFLSRTGPSNSLQDRNFAGLAAYCYEILIVDSVAVLHAIAQGRAPQSLKGGPWALRVYCATLKPTKPPSG